MFRSFLWHSSEPIVFLIYVVIFFFYVLKIDGHIRYWIVSIYYLLVTILLTRASFRIEGDTSNTFYYNLLYPITSIGISSYFFFLFQVNLKKVVSILTGLVSIVYYLFNLTEVYFDSIGYVISAAGIVILIFLYLHQILNHVTDTSLSDIFDFWFVCVQLMYQLGSFAIFLSYNYFTQQYLAATDDKREISIMLGDLWVVHNIILFIGAIVTSYAVVRVNQKKSTSKL